MIKWLLLAVACLVLTPLQGSLDAGCHAVAIQQQAVVAYQPIVAPLYYSVGHDLQTKASEERIANLVIQKLQSAQLNSQTSLDSSPQTLPLTAEVDRWQLVKANCAGCHTTNQAAMEHFNMTSLADLSCEQKLACIAAMLDGRMPKGKQIDSQTFANILGEFSGAATAHTP